MHSGRLPRPGRDGPLLAQAATSRDRALQLRGDPVAGHRPRVSVVIPVRDDARRLDRCLAALESQSIAEPYEVLVVDNGSASVEDVTAVVDAHAHARVLHEPRPSSYAARNRGVAAATGEVLAFTDSDCIPAGRWLERACAHLEAAGRSFIGGRVEVFASRPESPTAVERYEIAYAFPQSEYIRELRFCTTANLVVGRDVFEQVGSFSADLISSGDREWGERAHVRGVHPVYADDAVVRHPARRSLGALNRKVRRIETGGIQLRALRGQTLAPNDLFMVIPPVRLILSRLRQPPVAGSRLSYAGIALALHYLSAYHRLASALRARR